MKDSGKMKEAYDKEAKAPRKGVKAQDQDEYDAKGSFYDKSVKAHKAYGEQEHAPKGRGSRGPSQADGGPIQGWNQHVKPHGAYASQHKAGGGAEKASLGFKLPSDNAGYLGHFKGEEYLREGHNDAGSLKDFFFGGGDGEKLPPPGKSPLPTPEPKPKRTANLDEDGKSSAQKSMRKAFNYTDDD